MSAWTTLGWYAMGLAGIAGSALFSGLETGIYTLNRVRLHVLAHHHRGSAEVLQNLTRRPNRLLGTLLFTNNVVNYMASYAIAALFAEAGYTDWQVVGFNAALLTPLLFVFGEVVPKDLFRVYSDRLVYPFAYPLLWIQRGLMVTGMLPLVDAVSKALATALQNPEEGVHARHPRRVVTQLMKEGVGHGVLSAYQSNMIERVVHFHDTQVERVMVPWADVWKLRERQPPESVWMLAAREPYSRLPLVNDQDKPVGVVHVFDVLSRRPETCPPLTELAQPLPQVPPDMKVRDALLHLRQHRSSIGAVMADGRPIGIVTLKDLVEPTIGEVNVW